MIKFLIKKIVEGRRNEGGKDRRGKKNWKGRKEDAWREGKEEDELYFGSELGYMATVSRNTFHNDGQAWYL